MTNTDQPTGNAYYLDTGWTIGRYGLRFLACLVALTLVLSSGSLNLFTIAFGVGAVLAALYQADGLVKKFLNRGRPFIILGPTHFIVGHTQTAVTYAEVARFGFEYLGLTSKSVGFALISTSQNSFEKVKSAWPVANLGNCLLCRVGKIKTSPDDFYADFGQKLLAAGAEPVQSDAWLEEQKKRRQNDRWKFFIWGLCSPF